MTNVCSKAEKVEAFCNNLEGIVAIARKKYNDKIEVRVLENPASYTQENNPPVITGNGFKEKFSFSVDTREKLDEVMQNFVKTGKIEDPSPKEQKDALNEKEIYEVDDSSNQNKDEISKAISEVHNDIFGN